MPAAPPAADGTPEVGTVGESYSFRKESSILAVEVDLTSTTRTLCLVLGTPPKKA